MVQAVTSFAFDLGDHVLPVTDDWLRTVSWEDFCVVLQAGLPCRSPRQPLLRCLFLICLCWCCSLEAALHSC